MMKIKSKLTPYKIFEIVVFFCVLLIIVSTLSYTRSLSETGHVIHEKSGVNLISDLLYQPMKMQYPASKSHYRPQLTPVYLVEEHHEVLPYWFNAANRGLLPTRGNTLIHIDGHPDNALPGQFDSMPFFRFPKSEYEIFLLIQQNDAFIQEAVMAGYLNRWIYIFSSWDPEQALPASMHGDYISILTYLGVYKHDEEGEAPICACPKAEYRENKTCNRLTGYRGSVETRIPSEDCIIKREYLMEVMTEKKAIELFGTKDWLKPDENLILDIDEDFYGCEAACMPLYDVGIHEPEIEKLKNIIKRIFCPMDTTEEKKLDKLFYRLTQRLQGWTPNRENSTERAKFVDVVTDEVIHAVKCNKILVCLEDHKLAVFIKRLIVKLLKYNQEQLKALGEVGLCLSGTPKSVTFDYGNGARLCDGFNRPNETSVVFHTPTVEEINARTVQLGEILNLIPEPSIVTVCRSMRDGYTPRKFFQKIEGDVLTLLKDNFKNITQDSIHYDSDLLGGRYGWPNRHEL